MTVDGIGLAGRGVAGLTGGLTGKLAGISAGVVGIARRAGLFTGTAAGREIHAFLVARRVAAHLLHLRDESLRGVLVSLLLAVDERVGEDAAGADVYFAPLIFARHGVFVLLAKEADLGGVLEGGDVLREAIEFADEELDRAGVLLAAIDQELFFVALGFERDARQLAVEHDRDDCGHAVDQQKRVARFTAFHTTGFSCRGSVCVLLKSVSSMVMEVLAILTTR